MKIWGVAILLLLSLVVCAQSKDAAYAGSWTGTWTGGGGGGGLKLKLTQTDGKWSGEASFEIQGTDVPCVVKTLKIDGDSIAFSYEFDLQGTKLISNLTGKKKDKTLEGEYKTTTADGSQGVDNGSWKLDLK
jgi:hypothetical protein